MKIIKNAAGKYLIEADEKEILFLYKGCLDMTCQRCPQSHQVFDLEYECKDLSFCDEIKEDFEAVIGKWKSWACLG